MFSAYCKFPKYLDSQKICRKATKKKCLVSGTWNVFHGSVGRIIFFII